MRYAALALLVACAPPERGLATLPPVPNPFGPADPQWSPQPIRDHPLEVVIDDSGRAWVSLQGTPDHPGDAVVGVDLHTGERTRITTGGSSPTGLTLHPGGRWLVVFHRFSNFASVIDTRSDELVGELMVGFYAIEGVFGPGGARLWVTNRWHDAVSTWAVRDDDRGLQLVGAEERIGVAANPRDLALSADGDLLAVAAPTGLAVSLIDTATREERARIGLGAPANGVAWAGDWLVVPTTSASTHHLPLAGPDTDGDGIGGDGTPNVNFQDLQNELVVIDGAAAVVAHRYTSDSLCCADYRDVHPEDDERRGDLLPPRATWIVGGALPEQVATRPAGAGHELFVTFSASNQVQRFAMDGATGALTAGPTWSTRGHAPHGVAVAGGDVLVAHRLSETLGVYDAQDGTLRELHTVGDLSGGPFPATDAEIGALFNSVTAPFTVDGDQACTHCHREGGNLDKAFSMPLTRAGGLGSRMTMAYRGAYDTRPWFMESSFDQTNFKPVINEFARVENFCCSDYTLWPDGAPADCAERPPPACQNEPNTGSDDGFEAVRGRSPAAARPTTAPTRDAFYLQRAAEVIGRTESFGDGVYYEDPITLERRPLRLDFDGITRALGLFLMARTHLLPNPNAGDTDLARQGRALFERPDTGCAVCHPAPGFAASMGHNPHGVPLRMEPVVTPVRAADGTNLDLLATGFLDAFPLAEQDHCEDVCDPELCAVDPSVCDDLRNMRMGPPTLRGLWDRAPSLLHDGRAQGLREALATPGHPGLRAGERGFNERDGVPDTHGGTSHLSAAELDALVTYLETL